MPYENILAEVRGAIGWLAINRPKQMNALNTETLREIMAAVEGFDTDPRVRVVVVTGAGEKAFVAGADIKAMATMGLAEADQYGRLGHACMTALETMGKPVIAAVNGYALGGGTELALACDFIYAADTAVFALPEVTLGLFPGWGGTQRLAHIVGRPKAYELIFSGRRISALEAFQWGLVNSVVPKAELAVTVQQLADAIAANAPLAVRCAKQVIRQSAYIGMEEGLTLERSTFPRCFETEDAREGLTAFVEGRPAHFLGK